jgi:hypothetical protein
MWKFALADVLSLGVGGSVGGREPRLYGSMILQKEVDADRKICLE